MIRANSNACSVWPVYSSNDACEITAEAASDKTSSVVILLVSPKLQSYGRVPVSTQASFPFSREAHLSVFDDYAIDLWSLALFLTPSQTPTARASVFLLAYNCDDYLIHKA